MYSMILKMSISSRYQGIICDVLNVDISVLHLIMTGVLTVDYDCMHFIEGQITEASDVLPSQSV